MDGWSDGWSDGWMVGGCKPASPPLLLSNPPHARCLSYLIPIDYQLHMVLETPKVNQLVLNICGHSTLYEFAFKICPKIGPEYKNKFVRLYYTPYHIDK